jgi:non-specific serine/threonine protein kinase/serine/threonine-protein kinase
VNDDPDELDPTELPSTEAAPSPSGDRKQIGPYHLLQKLGEGGMGEVWLAKQTEPVKRRVALKIIKQGMDTKQVVARFEAERQALAMMDHPAVAKVFDAGTTPGGRPYFVMEYVKGVPITEHCDRHKLNNRERLGLFLQVCEGVQHAHQKAIIHRDLKPSNVLVSEQDGKRLPKIIDFGVAKATAQNLTEKTMFTELGVLIGTPEYMSPEQAELTGEDVDTRTDVYSLGVILYELLVGALPFDPKELRSEGFEGIRKKIREEEPRKPSTRLSTLGDQSSESARCRRVDLTTLQRQLRGDLDWITMKTLDKDRSRRYGSPLDLAADIERHLNHEPVLAGPPSASYRAKKFMRRHRWGVATSAAILIALLLGIIGATVGMVRATRAEQEARTAAEIAGQTTKFLVGLFQVNDPFFGTPSFDAQRGERLSARELLDQGAERIERELQDQPLVKAELLASMGIAYHGLGSYERSELLLQEALELQRSLLGPEDPVVLRNQWELAFTWHDWGDGRFITAVEELAPAVERVFGATSIFNAKVLTGLGQALRHSPNPEEAEPAFRRAIEIWEKHPEVVDEQRSFPYRLLGQLLYDQLGRVEEAEALWRTAYEIAAGVSEESPWTACVLTNLSRLARNRGEYEDAARLTRRSQAIFAEALPPGHPRAIGETHELSRLLCKLGKHGEALSVAEDGLERVEALPAAVRDPQSLQMMMWVIGRGYCHIGEMTKGKEWLDRAVSIMTDSGGVGSLSLYDQGCYRALIGEKTEAIRVLRKKLETGYGSAWIAHDPDLDSLRGNPEFEAIVAEVRAQLRDR